jgi:hypothetical protein
MMAAGVCFINGVSKAESVGEQHGARLCFIRIRLRDMWKLGRARDSGCGELDPEMVH